MNTPISRRGFLAGGMAWASSSSLKNSLVASEREVVRSQSQTLIKSLSDYLLDQQSPDGAWKSQTYALLRSGQALTPFVLSVLQDCDSRFAQSVKAARTRSWMIRQMRNGVLGVADPDVLEYPVFASAFALRCFQGMSDNDAEVDSLRRFLIREQFTESNGFPISHLAYGGWGFGATQPPGQTGHMDLSHTRWALAALNVKRHNVSSAGEQPVDSLDGLRTVRALGARFIGSGSRQDFRFRVQSKLLTSSATTVIHPAVLTAFNTKSQHLLRLLQKHPSETRPQPNSESTAVPSDAYDGGFYFSPIVLAANKGRTIIENGQTFFRSYATATCDGVIALLACGVDLSDERVVSARSWLEQHSDWEYPEGIPREYPEPWGDAVYFYHQAVRAEAYWRLGIGGDWPEQLVHRLQRHQRSDGSIVNQRSGLMKENDPLMCSALALIAAHYANRQINDATASSSAAR